MPVDPVGFWGAPTASIDWCEQNYALLPWVCEAFNTVSSLAIVLAGALGLSRQTFAREVRVAFALLVLVGLGSIAFHATLRFELQMLDELPMLYLVTWLVWLLVEDGRRPRLGRWFPAVLLAEGPGPVRDLGQHAGSGRLADTARSQRRRSASSAMGHPRAASATTKRFTRPARL